MPLTEEPQDPIPEASEHSAELLEDTPQPLMDHLSDLRSCLIRGFIGWGLASALAYAAFPRVLQFLIRPPIEKLVYTSPMEPFLAQMKISLILGFILVFPWLLYQLWRFVAPGLKPNERRTLLRLIPACYALFLAGGCMGLFVAAPLGLKFLLSYSTSYLMPYITLNSYMSYVGYLTLGTGALFQFPVVLFALSMLGILPYSSLARYRRHVFLGLLIVAAVITPSPDITGQVLIAVPTYLLFELSLLAMKMSANNGHDRS